MRANKPKRKNRQANFQDKDTVQTNRTVLKLTDDLRTKWHVSGRTSVNVTTTPYILDVAPQIVQGIGADNRIGDVIRILRADVTLSWTYGDPSNVCRFMAFWNLGMPPTGYRDCRRFSGLGAFRSSRCLFTSVSVLKKSQVPIALR